jgi:hypothetical protein
MNASTGTITYGQPLEPIEVDSVLQVWLWNLRVIPQPNKVVGELTCGRHRRSRQPGPNEIDRARIVYQMECHISQDGQVSVVYSFLERILSLVKVSLPGCFFKVSNAVIAHGRKLRGSTALLKSIRTRRARRLRRSPKKRPRDACQREFRGSTVQVVGDRCSAIQRRSFTDHTLGVFERYHEHVTRREQV